MPMAKFHFQNHQDVDIELIIEPWAMAKVIEPGAVVEFEVNDTPPPDLEFCITEKGRAYIYVLSERVRITVDGVDQEFTSPFRPSMDVFRAVRKSWSS